MQHQEMARWHPEADNRLMEVLAKQRPLMAKQHPSMAKRHPSMAKWHPSMAKLSNLPGLLSMASRCNWCLFGWPSLLHQSAPPIPPAQPVPRLFPFQPVPPLQPAPPILPFQPSFGYLLMPPYGYPPQMAPRPRLNDRNASANGPNPNKGAAHLALTAELDYNSSDEEYKDYAKAT
uniref:Uncharacterized protein n=1 Tax=Sphaerodactylus townsendi TaxID=933632 RepID=A0ACB8ED62_9SAUR